MASQAFGGSFSAYASTSPQKAVELLQVLGCEMAKMAAYGVTEEELARAQMQFKAGLLMSLESSANVMVRLGRAEILYQKVRNIEDLVADVMAVTPQAVQQMAERLLKPEKLVLALVGPEEPKIALEGLLAC